MQNLLRCGAVATGLSACAPATLAPVSSATATDHLSPAQVPAMRTNLELQAKARSFKRVVDGLEPVLETECLRRGIKASCDFQLVIDDRPGQPANAYQSQDARGRPVIAFTPALIVMASNKDELAFIMAHEAAHHILGHLRAQQENADLGARVLSGLARLAGRSERTTEAAREWGARVGVGSYAQQYELEADRLGARLAALGGFDPVRGALFFTRVPDPSDHFLSTHPPNAQRIQAVRDAVVGN